MKILHLTKVISYKVHFIAECMASSSYFLLTFDNTLGTLESGGGSGSDGMMAWNGIILKVFSDTYNDILFASENCYREGKLKLFAINSGI